MNHSCEPNAGLTNAFDLVALQDLEAGQEVRFDYSTTMDENFWTMPCACRRPSCRGIATDFRLLPAEVMRN